MIANNTTLKRPLFLLGTALTIFIAAGGLETATAQSLESLMQKADTTSPEVKTARLTYQSAYEQAGGAGVLPDPQLTISVAGSHLETRLGPQRARFTVMQMFPWFGTLDAEKQKEARMAEAAYHQYLDKRNLLFFQLSESYFELYRTRKIAGLTEQNIELAQSMESIALQYYQEGQRPMTDVLRVQIGREDLESQLSILREQEGLLVRTISLLVGQPTDLGELEVATPDWAGDANASIADNPGLATLSKMREASDINTLLAKKNGLPMAGIGFDYLVIGKGEGITLEDNGRDAWMPMVTMTLPIYRRKYKANVRASEVQAEAYASEYEGKVNALNREMEGVTYEAFKLRSMFDLLNSKIEKTEQILTIELSSYASNGSSFDDLLKTRQQLLMYQKEKENVLADGLINDAKRQLLTNAYAVE